MTESTIEIEQIVRTLQSREGIVPPAEWIRFIEEDNEVVCRTATGLENYYLWWDDETGKIAVNRSTTDTTYHKTDSKYIHSLLTEYEIESANDNERSIAQRGDD